MLQMVRIWSILICLAACGCNQLDLKGFLVPTSDGVQTRFEQSMDMNAKLKAGTVETTEEYIFYVAADPHVNKTHRHLDIFNDRFRNDSEVSFAVILGDCIDVRDNHPEYLKALEYHPERHLCKHPVFHVLGNHDIYFDGWEDFKELIGPSVYWFEAAFPDGKDLYITLDSASGTFGRKQTEWFREFLEKNRSQYRHCVILTHVNIFYTDNSQKFSGNLALEETYAFIDFLGKEDVTLVLQGHDHHREVVEYDDVVYTAVGTISDKSDTPEYLKAKVGPKGIQLDWQVDF